MAALFERALLASQLSHHDRGNGCVAYEQSVTPTYGYKPSLAAGIVFVVAFFLTFIVHCAQTAIKRQWWYSLIAIGALGKMLRSATSVITILKPFTRRASRMGSAAVGLQVPL